MRRKPRWYDAIPEATATIDCGGESHPVAWRRGKLVLLARDLAAERTMLIFGGELCQCMKVLEMWVEQFRMPPDLFAQMPSWLGDSAFLVPAELALPRRMAMVLSWERLWRKESWLHSKQADLLAAELKDKALAPLRQHVNAWKPKTGARVVSGCQVALVPTPQTPGVDGTTDRVAMRVTARLHGRWLVDICARGIAVVDDAFVVDLEEALTLDDLKVHAVRWEPNGTGTWATVVAPAHVRRDAGPGGEWHLTWDAGVTADSTTEIQAEQAVVDHAYRRLEAMRAEARELAADVLEHGAGGTFANRIERDVRMEARGRRLADLQVGEAGLVFGRIDPHHGDKLYIGRLAVADEENEPLVVDWRAPAAEPFYRATARHDMGLARRRHLILRGRRVVGLDDELLGDPADGADGDGALVLVGEGALLAALDRSRTGRMGDIVATIQREQDEIIRAPLPGILVVQGGPGTGKTAVALHRAAYLLYTHRFPLERSGVLLVGPNRIFLRYIEAVLPALGEHSVTLATPATLVGTAVRGTDSAAGARVKGDPRMAAVVAKAVADRGRGLPAEVSVLLHGRRLVLSSEASWRIAGQARRRPGTHNSRRPLVERLIARHLHRQAPEEEEADLASFEEAILRQRSVREALERMWPVLTPEDLLHDLYGSAALIRSAAGKVLTEDEQRLLQRPRSPRAGEAPWTEPDLALLDEASTVLGAPPARGPSGRRRAGDDPRRWEHQRVMADLPEMDAQMRRDVLRHLDQGDTEVAEEHLDPRSRTYGHILADEAQDLSPMQLRMLARRCPAGSMTLVGDLGQASGPWAPAAWDDVLAHLPVRRPPARTELSVNYRTPSEVMDMAARVLAAATPGLAPPASVRSAGLDPLVTEAAAGGAPLADVVGRVAAAELAAVGDGKVAVICPAHLLDALRDALPPVPEGAGVLDVDIALLAVDQAKGLEFDSVVLVEPAAIVAEGTPATGRRALYVAMTRTTRRLHIVHAEALPPELVGADARMAG